MTRFLLGFKSDSARNLAALSARCVDFPPSTGYHERSEIVDPYVRQKPFLFGGPIREFILEYGEYQHALLDAIEKRANCVAAYYQTQPVRIALDGEILWKGKVEVFKLQGHPQASLAFGWGFENLQKKMEYVTVVGIPPLDNPISAVKAFLASRRTQSQ